MRLHADRIELVDLDTDVMVRGAWIALQQATKSTDSRVGATLSGPSAVVVVDQLLAEVNEDVLNFWTRHGTDPEQAHTYSGVYLVHWSLPHTKEDPNA